MILFTFRTAISPHRNLSKDGIHLNDMGTFKLGDNFFKHVKVNGSFLNARNA